MQGEKEVDKTAKRGGYIFYLVLEITLPAKKKTQRPYQS
jgi:hypothetical protein